MKKYLLLVLWGLFFGSSLLHAQKITPYVEVKLSSADGGTGKEQATLRVFLPAGGQETGRMVIACPGGAYQHLAYTHEGIDWAPFFTEKGIALAVLKYRMPHGNREIPFSDLKAAIRMVRDSAEVWRINPQDVGVMGSSAGGHLASTAACHFPKEWRPAFQILFYPVITMDWKRTNRATRQNLLGADPTDDLVEEFSNEKHVTGETPRAFIARSQNDSPMGSEDYYRALQAAGVPAEYHVYPSGGHGWGFKESFPHREQMLEELTRWLDSFK